MSEFSMKVGDIVLDIATKENVIILEKKAEWIDTDGQIHMWDFKVYSSDGSIYCVDTEELEIVE